jgi:hypothetical protein
MDTQASTSEAEARVGCIQLHWALMYFAYVAIKYTSLVSLLRWTARELERNGYHYTRPPWLPCLHVVLFFSVHYHFLGHPSLDAVSVPVTFRVMVEVILAYNPSHCLRGILSSCLFGPPINLQQPNFGVVCLIISKFMSKLSSKRHSLKSPYGAPGTFARKKYCVCVDGREDNEITRKDRTPCRRSLWLFPSSAIFANITWVVTTLEDSHINATTDDCFLSASLSFHSMTLLRHNMSDCLP